MQRRLCPAAAALLAVVAAAVAAAPALAHDHHPVRAALPPGAIKHIFVVELENESEASTFGPTSPATYLNDTLVPQGEFIKNYYATGHVSLDNYIAQISGQAPTEETGADCLSPTTSPTGAPDPLGGLDCGHPQLGGVDNTNVAMPTDQYAARHNGFVYFHSIIDKTAECDANVVPLGKAAVGTPSTLDGTQLPDTFTGQLARDLARPSTTPRFGWITPNLCDDGHDSTCAGPNTTGRTGVGAGGLHGADTFLAHWMPLLMASPAYRSGQMLIVVTFDEASSADASACCGETPGPDNPTPGFSPLLIPLFHQLGLPIPSPAPGGGLVGAVLLNRRYIEPGSVDTTGFYNHYSALRSYEDLLGITSGGNDGLGHLGFASSPGLQPFGPDVFTRR